MRWLASRSLEVTLHGGMVADSSPNNGTGLRRRLRSLRAEARWLRRAAALLLLCDAAIIVGYLLARHGLRFAVGS